MSSLADKAADKAATTTRSVAIKYEDMEQPVAAASRMPGRSEAAAVLLEMEAVRELADFGRLFQLYLAKKLA